MKHIKNNKINSCKYCLKEEDKHCKYLTLNNKKKTSRKGHAIRIQKYLTLLVYQRIIDGVGECNFRICEIIIEPSFHT